MLHQSLSAIAVGSGSVLCFANDASPFDGRELGATAGRVRENVRGADVSRNWHLGGVYETADPSAHGEAVAIKEKCFDRCEGGAQHSTHTRDPTPCPRIRHPH